MGLPLGPPTTQVAAHKWFIHSTNSSSSQHLGIYKHLKAVSLTDPPATPGVGSLLLFPMCRGGDRLGEGHRFPGGLEAGTKPRGGFGPGQPGSTTEMAGRGRREVLWLVRPCHPDWVRPQSGPPSMALREDEL